MAGLATGLLLTRDGHRVTLLEKDATPFPESPMAAFERWDRRGAPQVRHSHAFLARLRNELRDRAPDLLAALLEAGAEELPFDGLLRPEIDDRSPREGDEDLVMLACRRITFEWVLHHQVQGEPGVTLRDGCEVLGLEAEPQADGPPRVCGVRIRHDGGEEVLAADLVVDASGRRSRLPRWLDAIGAEAPEEASEACGIFYCSRFYRLRPGAETPPRDAVIGADLGYLKYGIFHGDGNIFSLTFAAPPEDKGLRALLRTAPFEAAARALPATEPWVAPEIAEPITDVHGMDRLMNTRRQFVRDGRPLARSVVAVGDAAIHTNPMYGRGCTFAVVYAALLADALRAHPDDRDALAVALAEAEAREVVPWYELTLGQDRDAIELAASLREPAEPETQQATGAVDPKAYMRDLMKRGLLPALRTDATVLRAFMRAVNLLEPPGDLMRDPEVLRRVIASYEARDTRIEPDLGPDRASMLELLADAA